jgi:LPS-assembly lipoprotein
MWWPDPATVRRFAIRLGAVAAAGALLAGCFQPLYGEHSFTSTPGIAAAMSSVDVAQIEARVGDDPRVAVELRNQLLFNLTGGSGGKPPAYRLVIKMITSKSSLIVDDISGRPEDEDYGIDVSYELRDLKTGKPVLSSDSFARVSYDIPGQEQRFARQRALRDSENRAAKQIADNIKARLASYFVAGT